VLAAAGRLRHLLQRLCPVPTPRIYAEREKNIELADRIKQISPVSWKHVNFYGKYIFRDNGEVVGQMVSQLVAIEWEGADPKQPNRLTALRQN
jgi:hypothetical protein